MAKTSYAVCRLAPISCPSVGRSFSVSCVYCKLTAAVSWSCSYVAWVRGYEHAALLIETLVRGFLGRCRFKHLRAIVMMDKVFTPR